ncbi:MAG: hypothetical protein ACUVX8_11035 [Candidatus Zipacnadales bacterium]
MGNQKGQALLIAVLLMTVILLVGAIFVAVTIYVQSQTQRHGQMRQSKEMADAGIQYADRMLELYTADWRPPDPPAWCAGADGTFDTVDAILDPSYGGDDQFDPGFWGPDGTPDSDDDYYTPEELERGWCARRLGDALPPDPANPLFPDVTSLASQGELVTRGFSKLPDPRRGVAPGLDLPAHISKGHVLLRLTYDPDPPFEGVTEEDLNGDTVLDYRDADPASQMIRIESVGTVLDETYTFYRMVAYKPLVLTSYARFITDKSGTGQPAYLGIPPVIDFARDGRDDGLPDRYVTHIVGSVRANTELVFVGQELPSAAGADQGSVQIDLRVAAGPGSGTGVSYAGRESIQSTAGISYRDPVAPPHESQALVRVIGPGGTTEGTIYPTVTPPSVPGMPSFSTHGALTGDGLPAVADGYNGTDAAGFGRFTVGVGAPDLGRRDPTTGRTVYEELTRYSGDSVMGPDGYYVNNGEWGHGAGVYINNVSDRQFVNARGECDISTLIDDWLRNISPTDARAGDSGWNGVQTTYSPVGVEIWLVGEELPPDMYVVQADPRAPAIPDSVYWTPAHTPGMPQIVLRRHDQHWRTATGEDSGRYVMVIDHPSRLVPTWPSNQVIYAAGNVRVWGKLPDRGPMPTPGSGETSAAVPYPDYNLTIVSGGTIYIDGSILSPEDWVPGWVPGAWDDRESRLALLARDCVCLNTTRIVPQEATALVTAEPDDTDNPRPEASHWELVPQAGARVYSSWQFGAPAASNVYLAVVASGREPGPAALAMSLQTLPSPLSGLTPADFGWTPFFFGGAVQPLRFHFLPPGAGSDVNISNALTPEYQPVPPRPKPGGPTTPTLPWNITGYISTAPGTQNSLAIQWANPQLSAGATNVWIKKWKIVESSSGDPNDLTAIVPAVHCRVNATIYAERGCWFIIPGPWFETIEAIDAALGPAEGDNINGQIDTPDEVARAEAYVRYNYDILVRGSITENFTAPVDAVYEWTDKWCCNSLTPYGSRMSIRYVYDDAVRAQRDRGNLGDTSPAAPGTPILRRSTDSANLPKVPLLPVSPDLLYYGEAM